MNTCSCCCTFRRLLSPFYDSQHHLNHIDPTWRLLLDCQICSFSRSTTDTNCLQRFHWSSKALWIVWQGQKNQSKHQSSGSCREQSFCTNLAELLKDRVLANNDIEWQFYIVFSPMTSSSTETLACFLLQVSTIWELSLVDEKLDFTFLCTNCAYLLKFSFQALHTNLFFKV
jgi:hypothetical protein